ncbi:iron-sulfur cluster assembly protein [Gordonia sp. NPDC003424]
MTVLVDVAHHSPVDDAIHDALSGVLDPHRSEPIVAAGLVAAVAITDGGVKVVLRLPESFGSAALAFVLGADVLDALYQVDDIGEVAVTVVDHPDSAQINVGLRSDACCLEVLGSDQIAGLRSEFDRQAHTTAVRRCLDAMVAEGRTTADRTGHVLLRDVPPGSLRNALMRRRANLGLSLCPNSRVLVDHTGQPRPGSDRRPPIAS